jgi:hypothetical protein
MTDAYKEILHDLKRAASAMNEQIRILDKLQQDVEKLLNETASNES